MPEKKIALDILGNTHLPSDLLTHSLGSNYGMDGFPDVEYGAGTLEGILDPDLTAAPALPDGLVRGAAAEMDLSGMMGESLADLDWLDPTQMQDPDRLPKTPESIPELEEAWGVDRRTDGQRIVASDLESVRYERSLKEGGRAKKATSKQMFSVVAKAMRRSASGQNIDTIVKQALESMGGEMGRVASHLKIVRSEHGLAGNVFIRAAAYPGYETGRWGKKLKKTGARYVIVTENQLKQATWIEKGRCTYTRKLAVTEIPWGKAFNYYLRRDRRVAAIYDAPTTGSYLLILREAFLSPEPKRVAETHFHHQPQQRLASDSEVREALAKKPARKVVSNTKHIDSGVRKVAGAIHRGLRGEPLKGMIRQTFMARDMKAAVKALTPLIKEADAFNVASKREAEYSGRVYTQAQASGTRSAGRIAGQVRAAVKYVRKAMTEGFAGGDLDTIIAKRFASATREAAAEQIREVRAAHEGGSGFIYVDAEVYASPTGKKGCEEGSLKHRANQIKAVAEMNRCATCTLVRTLEDGTRKCGVYNKLLLADTQDPDFTPMKQANVKVANLGDYEQTQLMFMTPENAYSPGEYRLANNNLEAVDIDFPEHEKVAEITFGSWDL